MLTIPPSPPPLPQSVFGELNGADRQKWGKERGEGGDEDRGPPSLHPNACGPDFAVAAVSRGGRGGGGGEISATRALEFSSTSELHM